MPMFSSPLGAKARKSSPRVVQSRGTTRFVLVKDDKADATNMQNRHWIYTPALRGAKLRAGARPPQTVGQNRLVDKAVLGKARMLKRSKQEDNFEINLLPHDQSETGLLNSATKPLNSTFVSRQPDQHGERGYLPRAFDISLGCTLSMPTNDQKQAPTPEIDTDARSQWRWPQGEAAMAMGYANRTTSTLLSKRMKEIDIISEENKSFTATLRKSVEIVTSQQRKIDEMEMWHKMQQSAIDEIQRRMQDMEVTLSTEIGLRDEAETELEEQMMREGQAKEANEHTETQLTKERKAITQLEKEIEERRAEIADAEAAVQLLEKQAADASLRASAAFDQKNALKAQLDPLTAEHAVCSQKIEDLEKNYENRHHLWEERMAPDLTKKAKLEVAHAKCGQNIKEINGVIKLTNRKIKEYEELKVRTKQELKDLNRAYRRLEAVSKGYKMDIASGAAALSETPEEAKDHDGTSSAASRPNSSRAGSRPSSTRGSRPSSKRGSRPSSRRQKLPTARIGEEQ